jgi:hypothetical protein
MGQIIFGDFHSQERPFNLFSSPGRKALPTATTIELSGTRKSLFEQYSAELGLSGHFSLASAQAIKSGVTQKGSKACAAEQEHFVWFHFEFQPSGNLGKTLLKSVPVIVRVPSVKVAII